MFKNALMTIKGVILLKFGLKDSLAYSGSKSAL